MASESRVEKVIRSAWERRLLVSVVERGGIAAAIVLGGFIILLLVGTQILSGYWLALLALIGASITGYQVYERSAPPYRVAQQLDHRLRLADSLSTAWYLLSQPARRHEHVTEMQLKTAERAAESVDVAKAFPFTGGRVWWVSGGLAVLALGMFSIRYLVTDSFSLQPSILPFSLADVFERTGKDSAAQQERKNNPGQDKSGPKSSAKTADHKDAKDQPKTDPQMLGKPDNSGTGQNAGQKAEMLQSPESQPGSSDKPASKGGNSAEQRPGENSGEKGEESASSKKPSSDDKANTPQSSNGLIDRMKDALTSMAAKLKPNGQGKQDKNEQRSGEEQKGDQQSAAGKDQESASRQDQSQTSANASEQSAQGQSQGQTKEKTRAGQGKSSEPFGDKSKSDSHSGVGSQDGDKAIKDADQLKAMGKLAEIIGKRSESASGDMMVENPAGKQRLQTAYSQRLGHHADLGGEINRDEVPLAYQQYVRDYISQMRKIARKHK